MSRKILDAIIVPTARSQYKYPVHNATTLSDVLRVNTIVIRDETIANARNQGLRIARSCGWERIMFLDDDIWIKPEQIVDNVFTLRSVQVVAFTPAHFPDNSVVRHAARLAGIPTPVFPSGSAMMVNIKKTPETRLFPWIYNEDWFFMHGLHVVNGGNVEQNSYNPFVPGRATWEELGDLIAEAIQDKPVTYDKDFWGNAIRERAAFLNSLHVEGAAAASIREASRLLSTIKVANVRGFLRMWQREYV